MRPSPFSDSLPPEKTLNEKIIAAVLSENLVSLNELLLANPGLDLNTLVDEEGKSLLVIACSHHEGFEKNEGVVDAILGHMLPLPSSKLNSVIANTALITAAFYLHLDGGVYERIVRKLLNLGADVNYAHPKTGLTTLHYAVYRRRTEFSTELVAIFKANVNAVARRMIESKPDYFYYKDKSGGRRYWPETPVNMAWRLNDGSLATSLEGPKAYTAIARRLEKISVAQQIKFHVLHCAFFRPGTFLIRFRYGSFESELPVGPFYLNNLTGEEVKYSGVRFRELGYYASRAITNALKSTVRTDGVRLYSDGVPIPAAEAPAMPAVIESIRFSASGRNTLVLTISPAHRNEAGYESVASVLKKLNIRDFMELVSVITCIYTQLNESVRSRNKLLKLNEFYNLGVHSLGGVVPVYSGRLELGTSEVTLDYLRRIKSTSGRSLLFYLIAACNREGLVKSDDETSFLSEPVKFYLAQPMFVTAKDESSTTTVIDYNLKLGVSAGNPNLHCIVLALDTTATSGRELAECYISPGFKDPGPINLFASQLVLENPKMRAEAVLPAAGGAGVGGVIRGRPTAGMSSSVGMWAATASASSAAPVRSTVEDGISHYVVCAEFVSVPATDSALPNRYALVAIRLIAIHHLPKNVPALSFDGIPTTGAQQNSVVERVLLNSARTHEALCSKMGVAADPDSAAKRPRV